MLAMAVVLERERVGRKEERGKAVELVRTGKQLTAAPQPDPETRQIVKMEFPYDDLYLMYDYITKELGIKPAF